MKINRIFYFIFENLTFFPLNKEQIGIKIWPAQNSEYVGVKTMALETSNLWFEFQFYPTVTV